MGKDKQTKYIERKSNTVVKTGRPRVPCYLHGCMRDDEKLILQENTHGISNLCCYPGSRCQAQIDGTQQIAPFIAEDGEEVWQLILF